MPVSEGPQLNLPRTIAFAVASLALGVALLFVIVWLAGSGDVQFKLGDDVFDVGEAERRAETVAEGRDGRPAPLAFPSLSRNRPIYVHHVGDEPDEGWVALDARSPSNPDGSCALEWDLDEQQFFDGCDPSNVFAADGTGLLQYGISVDTDGNLIVDLNQDPDDSAE